jgi:large subunit ribosomal protein L29
MENTEIRELSTQDIIEKIEEEKARLVRMRLNHEVSPLENPNQLKEVKVVIARLKTELRARQLSGNA